MSGIYHSTQKEVLQYEGEQYAPHYATFNVVVGALMFVRSLDTWDLTDNNALDMVNNMHPGM